MKKRECMGKISTVAIAAGFVLSMAVGMAFAHEEMEHGKEHGGDVKMEKQHKMMPMYSQAEAKISEALINGDAATVKTETGEILATIPDLKMSKPHKNLKQIATFRRMASAFGADVKKTAVLAKTGDFAGARDAFQFARARCNECHSKFRD